jgi:hypothetical protein
MDTESPDSTYGPETTYSTGPDHDRPLSEASTVIKPLDSEVKFIVKAMLPPGPRYWLGEGDTPVSVAPMGPPEL